MDTVLFTVRQLGYRDRLIKWRFNGTDGAIHFNQLDPSAQFADDVTIYVNR